TDPAFLGIAVLAVLLVGVSKSGFGGAMGSLAVPLMSLLIATPVAAAILLPIMLVMDMLGLLVFRGKGDMANLRIIIPGAMIGILLGTLTFRLVDAHLIKGVIGLEALLPRRRTTHPPVSSASGHGPGAHGGHHSHLFLRSQLRQARPFRFPGTAGHVQPHYLGAAASRSTRGLLDRTQLTQGPAALPVQHRYRRRHDPHRPQTAG
ncbi:sulfite exporter TauE/SafE family protein, partial [bacterium]|nr:sulfite exporter TauE/SafE family protein [bacterium]